MPTDALTRSRDPHSRIARHRIAISRLYFVPVIALVLCTTGTFAATGIARVAVDGLAYSAITVAALGRLWCSVYICGNKTRRLVDEGPYSAVRNPLYLFSFCGGVGAALMTHSLLVVAAVVLFFLIVYPATVRNEERALLESLGDVYERYRDATPAFVPDRALFRTPRTRAVDMPGLQRAFLDAIWFFIGFALLYALELAKVSGTLGSLGAIP